MDIILYRNVSPPNQVQKKNNNNKFIKDHNQGRLISDVRFTENNTLDFLNPELLLKLTSDIEDITVYNYVKIPKFDRFYYIDDITAEGGLIRLKCRVDVLMSHKTDILKSKQYVMRQQNKNNSPYLEDNLLPIRADHCYYAKPFGDNVTDISCGRVIMATTGKGGTVI